MKFNKNLLKEKWVAYTIALCTAVLLYMVLTHLGAIAGILGKLWKVFSPVIIAFVIAFVLVCRPDQRWFLPAGRFEPASTGSLCCYHCSRRIFVAAPFPKALELDSIWRPYTWKFEPAEHEYSCGNHLLPWLCVCAGSAGENQG